MCASSQGEVKHERREDVELNWFADTLYSFIDSTLLFYEKYKKLII